MSKILYVSQQYIEARWHQTFSYGEQVLVEEHKEYKIFVGLDCKGFFILYKLI